MSGAIGVQAPAAAPAREGTEVLLRVDGPLARLTLNRPKAINALTLEMVRQLWWALDRIEDDPAVRVVLLDGAGERGLCAGGDIVALHGSAASEGEAARIFWTEEYLLDARIARFPRPFVSILDGIVMGGGIGVGGHASHRLATERLVSAMPEVGIGFAPDVGGTWLLSRGPGELGTHLALTGARVGARDAVLAGLADRVIASTAVPGLVEALAGGEAVEAAIAAAEVRREDGAEDAAGAAGADERGAEGATGAGAAVVEVPPGELAEARAWIDAAYAAGTVEEIVAALQARPEPAAAKAAERILSASPTSVKVTLRALREAAALPDLAAALRQELRISCGFLRAGDFVEGVRAQVIDKDRNPRWAPPTLEAVDPATVDGFFAPLGEHELPLDSPASGSGVASAGQGTEASGAMGAPGFGAMGAGLGTEASGARGAGQSPPTSDGSTA